MLLGKTVKFPVLAVARARMDPEEYFKSRPESGFTVGLRFMAYVLPKLRPVDVAPAVELSAARLLREASSTEILAELPKARGVEWHHMASIISMQLSTSKKPLISGEENIFFVRGDDGMVFTVVVYYDGDEVMLDDATGDEDNLLVGTQVFFL